MPFVATTAYLNAITAAIAGKGTIAVTRVAVASTLSSSARAMAPAATDGNMRGTGIVDLTLSSDLLMELGSNGTYQLIMEDARTGTINVEEVGIWVTPSLTNTQIFAGRFANTTDTPFYTRTSGETTFVLGYKLVGGSATDVDLTMSDVQEASTADVDAGVNSTKMITSRRLKYFVDKNVFPVTRTQVTTSAGRNLRTYTTPGEYLLQAHGSLSWQNGPDGLASNSDVELSVRRCGPNSSDLAFKLVGADSSGIRSTWFINTSTAGAWPSEWTKLGSIELANTSDVNTGSDDKKAIVSSVLAASTRGRRIYIGTTRPAGIQANDIWLDTST